MNYEVRKVVNGSRLQLGFGVFKSSQLKMWPSKLSVDIRLCSDPDDPRPLKLQRKSVRLISLHPRESEAQEMVQKLNAEGRFNV